jgi:signal recognition particle subunit SRP54
MLESLSDKLKESLQKLTRLGSIDKEAVENLIKDIQRSLLSGDVDVKLVFQLCEEIRKRAFDKTPSGMTRKEYVVKVVYEELTKILGEKKPDIALKPKKILLIGLFGSGKTSTAAKLARYYHKRGLRPALVCCDTVRPAAYEQLQQLAAKIDVPFYGNKNEKHAASVLKEALKKIKADIIIVDSSGRDALDKDLINEIKEINDTLKPDEKVLVLPADIGQVAKQQSEAFQAALGITDVIITKMDATAKGGGALTACYETGAKVKFLAIGETPDDLDVYDPPKFVARLIGLPDLETLLEKAKDVADEDLARKIIKADFDLNDFYQQMESMQQIGPLSNIAGMLGLGSRIPKDALEQQQEKIKKWKHILNSMTPAEKMNPDIIDPSRVRRIARGCGRPESDVRELLNNYNKTKKIIKQINPGKMRPGDVQKFMKGMRF